MARILFGYRSSPCYREPFDFTTEFKITDKGTLIVRIFNEPLKADFKHKTSLPEQVASDLSKVLTKYADRIKSFPTVIENNLVMDGISQQFTLSGKKIDTSNIGRWNADTLKRIKADGNIVEYRQAIMQNDFMEIITEIYPILKPHGMNVTDWNHFECDWTPLAELADFAEKLIGSRNIFPKSYEP